MNKEQLELLDEAYKNYCDNINLPPTKTLPLGTKVVPTLYTQEEFIGIVITNPDFAKHWGVTLYTVVEDENIRIGINYKDKTIESYE
jgi:hypothetical protein